jgi:hypothetical protein
LDEEESNVVGEFKVEFDFAFVIFIIDNVNGQLIG